MKLLHETLLLVKRPAPGAVYPVVLLDVFVSDVLFEFT